MATLTPSYLTLRTKRASIRDSSSAGGVAGSGRKNVGLARGTTGARISGGGSFAAVRRESSGRTTGTGALFSPSGSIRTNGRGDNGIGDRTTGWGALPVRGGVFRSALTASWGST